MFLVPAARASIKALQAGNKLQYLFQGTQYDLYLEDERKNPEMEKRTEGKQDVLLSTQFCSDLIGQTILVSFEVNWTNRTARAITDTDSKPSYVLKKTALEMGCQPVKSQRVIHSLFGGGL